jgi:hypothetical protein
MRLQDLSFITEQQLREQAVAQQAHALLESATPEELILSEPRSAEDVIAELYK